MGLKESVLAQVNPWQLLTAFRPQNFFHIIRQHFKSDFQRYLQKSQIVSRRHLAGGLNGFEVIGTGTSQSLAAAHSLSSANFLTSSDSISRVLYNGTFKKVRLYREDTLLVA
jgi:hypothetical protein